MEGFARRIADLPAFDTGEVSAVKPGALGECAQAKVLAVSYVPDGGAVRSHTENVGP